LSNEDDPVPVPGFAYVAGKGFCLPAIKMKLVGKTAFKFGRARVKSFRILLSQLIRPPNPGGLFFNTK
jgi:hypothetical protein